MAVQCQHEKCANILLEHGADPKAADAKGYTALHYAAHHGMISMAEKLLSLHVHVDVRSEAKMTPLLCAINADKPQMVEFLLNKNANVYAVDEMHRTALMFAAKHRSTYLVELFLHLGVNPCYKDDLGYTAEIYANFSGFNTCCELLSKSVEKFKPEMFQSYNAIGKKSSGDSIQSIFKKPKRDDSRPTKGDDVLDLDTKEGERISTIGEKENGIDVIEQEQRKKDDLTCDRVRRTCRQSARSNFRTGDDEVIESFWESEVDEETHRRSEMETSKNVLDGAVALSWDEGDGFTQQSAKVDHQQFPAKENLHERNLEEERPTKETSKEKKKSYQAASEDHDLPHSNYKNPAVLRVDSKDADSQIKIQDAMLPGERLIEHKESHYEELIGRIQRLENEESGLQKELSETKEINSQLEVKKVKWEEECCSLWENLKDKEEQYNEVEVKGQLEIDLRTLDVELDTGKDTLYQVEEEHENTKKKVSLEQSFRIIQDEIMTHHLYEQEELEMTQKKRNSEVSDKYKIEKYPLGAEHILQNEIAQLRVEIDKIQHLNQEKEKKYVEDIQILKEKTHDLEKTIKWNEASLSKTISQHSEELNVLRTQNMMLNYELENEKQSKERLEAEVESYHSRLAAAIRDRDQNQKSKRDLELAFQRTSDTWFCVQRKMNEEIMKLKEENESLSQPSETESKVHNLQTVVYLREKTPREENLLLQQVERILSKAQGLLKEIEFKYEENCRLQSKNMLLRQQLENAQKEADAKARTMDMQDRLCETIKHHVQSEKQSLMVQEK
ncbi:Ankyrin repeat domain-containing protein 26 [Tupaia chinensis]|uniref:Ankyrin repeat domain-containing protein 26 n=1 Tax=Tupaia chinensis TaxID=246437 RepID=L9JMP0_TUPCH|nr:Ankyrin repeat domain-containing protein 26 [Tupaia chinensis]